MRRAAFLTVLAAAAASFASACEKRVKDSGPDENAPEVESTDPENGATSASVLAVVSATFSEDMDPDTITAETFRLTSGGTLVPGTVAYADRTATLTPTAALQPGTTYAAQVRSDASDEAGNQMESAYSWSFTTTSGEFVLSSDAFGPGATIPDEFTCDGVDRSPPLAWTAGPAGTQSYAIVFTDLDNALIHWAIWDIPAAITALDAGVPNDAFPNPPGGGAKQAESYGTLGIFGYRGPCPIGELHTYEFVVYAVDVATLPNVTTGSTRAEVEAEILLHDLGSASLSGTSDAG